MEINSSVICVTKCNRKRNVGLAIKNGVKKKVITKNKMMMMMMMMMMMIYLNYLAL